MAIAALGGLSSGFPQVSIQVSSPATAIIKVRKQTVNAIIFTDLPLTLNGYMVVLKLPKDVTCGDIICASGRARREGLPC